MSLTYAEIKPYTLNEESDIIVTCLNDGYCSINAYCNINIIAPNSTLIVTGQNMTNHTTFFNYTIVPVDVGLYNVEGICIDGEDSKEVNFDFRVTKTGSEYTEPMSMNFLSITLLMIFIVCALGFLSFKARNPFVIISCLAFAVLILFFYFGMMTSLSDLTFENFTGLASNMESLFILSTILVGVGAFCLIVYLIVIVLQMYWAMRGMTDIVSVKGL